MYPWQHTHNDDTGSLHTGVKLSVGDVIEIEGENKHRTVTYVMGSDAKGWRACFKGQGALPVGPLEWRIVRAKITPETINTMQTETQAQSYSDRSIKERREWGCESDAENLNEGLSTSFNRLKLGTSPDKPKTPFIAIGCDVGVSAYDKNTGTVILTCVPEGDKHRVSVVKRYNFTATEAQREIARLVKEHNASYLVLDAPLLPRAMYGVKPMVSFRPHEKLAANPDNATWDKIFKGDINNPNNQKIMLLNSRIQAMPTWLSNGNLNDFTRTAKGICESVDLPFIEDPALFYNRGVFEGFPKMFFFPLIDGNVKLSVYTDSQLYPRGKFDAGVLSWLFAPSMPENFWGPSGLLMDDGDIENLLTLEDDHVICGLSMALAGVLYGLGKITFVRSRTESHDYGHWTFPDWAMFKPWAKEWLKTGMQKFARAENARFICYTQEG
ncbi:MAG: hypothetical protein HQM16_17060 [Deltaproteobacteria bacterium]|nr:hypothetical protein [Deltaproteobacteria bacterium]